MYSFDRYRQSGPKTLSFRREIHFPTRTNVFLTFFTKFNQISLIFTCFPVKMTVLVVKTYDLGPKCRFSPKSSKSSIFGPKPTLRKLSLSPPSLIPRSDVPSCKRVPVSLTQNIQSGTSLAPRTVSCCLSVTDSESLKFEKLNKPERSSDSSSLSTMLF